MTEKKQKIPEEVLTISDTLQGAEFEAYLVGGCVRDLLMGREPKDWDLATNAKPEDVIGLFPHTHYDNEFGTVGIVNDEADDMRLKTVEITTYRKEGKYSDKRHPDSVVFSETINDDLSRRDFTINAMALNMPIGVKDISKGHLVDLFLGKQALKDGLVQAVGDPVERFGEDALRLMRAARFATELGFAIEEKTEAAIKKTVQHMYKIAKERIRDELIRMIMSDRPKDGIELLHDLGLLQFILPEIEYGINVEQNQAHTYSVWEHLLRSLQATADKGWALELRLAALLHDVAKPKTRAWDNKKNDWSFHGHQVVGAYMAKKALQRLRFPNEVIDKVFLLVRWHMFFSDTDVLTHSAVRRVVRNVGKDNIWDLISIRVADRVGTGRPKEEPYRLRKYKSMIEEVMRDPISVDMLEIDGKKIMDVTRLARLGPDGQGETPGPRIGFILHALLEEVLDDPAKNTPEYLENRTQELAKLKDEELKRLGTEGQRKKEEEEAEELKKIRREHHVT